MADSAATTADIAASAAAKAAASATTQAVLTGLAANAQPNPAVQWAQHYQYVVEMMDRAAQTFYLGVDKELTAKAAYKALGLDPRDAPTFGWGLMQTAKAMNDITTNPVSPVSASASATAPAPAPEPAPPPISTPAPQPIAPPANPPWWSQPPAPAAAVVAPSVPWWQAALLTLGVVSLPVAGYIAAKQLNATPASAQPAPVVSPATPAQGWQMQFEYKQADGTWQPVGGPVPIQPGGK